MANRTCPACGAAIETGWQQSGRKFCSDACKPRCAVEGCGQPRRKRTWCGSHYAQWKRTGQEPRPFIYKWSERRPCLVCGRFDPESIHRRFCSDACRVMHDAYDGNVPSSTRCVLCGVEVDLTARGKGGQRRKVTTKLCRPCKQDYNKYKMSARQLAERDGTDCGICGETVDMTLRRSDDLMCPSVDHVTPRAHGGTHDPENLQLAHLLCNQRKSDRVGSVLVAGD